MNRKTLTGIAFAAIAAPALALAGPAVAMADSFYATGGQHAGPKGTGKWGVITGTVSGGHLLETEPSPEPTEDLPPAEEIPAEEVPAEETPAEEAPAEDTTPAEEAVPEAPAPADATEGSEPGTV